MSEISIYELITAVTLNSAFLFINP